MGKYKETLLNPIFKGNPITVLVLGICSSLAVTVELKGALVMALSVTIVTGLSSLVCQSHAASGNEAGGGNARGAQSGGLHE